MPPVLSTRDLQHRDPEILNVLERLAGNDDISRVAGHLFPSGVRERCQRWADGHVQAGMTRAASANI